jgi:hypothetical protein
LQARKIGDVARQSKTLFETIDHLITGVSAPPIALQARLCVISQNQTQYPESLSGDDWMDYRSKASILLFRVWERIKQSRIPNFDFNQRLLISNVHVPKGPDNSYGSGVEPSAVKDREQRERYIARTATNTHNLRIWTEQEQLRRLDADFSSRAEAYLIRAYSKDPFNTKELRYALDKNVDDKAMIDRIIKAVTRRDQP